MGQAFTDEDFVSELLRIEGYFNRLSLSGVILGQVPKLDLIPDKRILIAFSDIELFKALKAAGRAGYRLMKGESIHATPIWLSHDQIQFELGLTASVFPCQNLNRIAFHRATKIDLDGHSLGLGQLAAEDALLFELTGLRKKRVFDLIKVTKLLEKNSDINWLKVTEMLRALNMSAVGYSLLRRLRQAHPEIVPEKTLQGLYREIGWIRGTLIPSIGIKPAIRPESRGSLSTE